MLHLICCITIASSNCIIPRPLTNTGGLDINVHGLNTLNLVSKTGELYMQGPAATNSGSLAISLYTACISF